MARLWVRSDLHLETALFPDAYDPPRPGEPECLARQKEIAINIALLL